MNIGETVAYIFEDTGMGHWITVDDNGDITRDFRFNWHTSGGEVTITYHALDLILVYRYSIQGGNMTMVDWVDTHHLWDLDYGEPPAQQPTPTPVPQQAATPAPQELDELLVGFWMFVETSTDFYAEFMADGFDVYYIFHDDGTGIWDVYDAEDGVVMYFEMRWFTENGILTIAYTTLDLVLTYAYEFDGDYLFLTSEFDMHVLVWD